MPYFTNAGVFLIQTLFGFYILAVMLRFLLQWIRADFYNPIVQALVKITNPPLIRLRRVIPGFLGIDMAAVVLMIALQLIETTLVLWFSGVPLQFGGILVLSVASLLSLLIYVYIFSILIAAIISWVNPDPYSPVVQLLRQLTEPALRPARQLLPPMGGLDLSPLIVLMVLYMGIFLLVHPLMDLGRGALRAL